MSGLSGLKVASDAYSAYSVVGPTYESECSLCRRVQPEACVYSGGRVLAWPAQSSGCIRMLSVLSAGSQVQGLLGIDR